MTLKDKIEKYYFKEGLNQSEIADKLKINQSTICRILQSFGKLYMDEKQKRKEVNKKKEAEKKKIWIAERRKNEKLIKYIDKCYEEEMMAGLKEQQIKNAISMSRKSKISDIGIVTKLIRYYSYDEEKKVLNFEEKYGAIPNDVPKKYPVHTEKY